MRGQGGASSGARPTSRDAVSLTGETSFGRCLIQEAESQEAAEQILEEFKRLQALPPDPVEEEVKKPKKAAGQQAGCFVGLRPAQC